MEDLRPAAHRDHLSVDRALAALPDLLRVLNAFLKWLLGFISSVRSSNSHPDLIVISTPLFQITTVLDTGLSLSEPTQLNKGYNAI